MIPGILNRAFALHKLQEADIYNPDLNWPTGRKVYSDKV
jgi:hypothetical protein